MVQTIDSTIPDGFRVHAQKLNFRERLEGFFITENNLKSGISIPTEINDITTLLAKERYGGISQIEKEEICGNVVDMLSALKMKDYKIDSLKVYMGLRYNSNYR